MRFRYLPLLLLCALFFSCDLGTGTSTTTTTTVAPTAVQVKVEISRAKNDTDGTNQVEYFVDVFNNGTEVVADSVSINGVDVPQVPGFSPYNELTSASPTPATYIPGTTYTVIVNYHGTAYTDSMTAPGGITVNSNATQASWLYNGNASSVSVNRYGYAGTDTFTRSDSVGDLTNPLNIASSAYPSAGTAYDLRINIKRKKSTFGSLSGSNTYFNISDFWLKDVAK